VKKALLEIVVVAVVEIMHQSLLESESSALYQSDTEFGNFWRTNMEVIIHIYRNFLKC
jgi:hypothetical protein